MLRPALQFTAYIEVGLVTAIDRAFTHWDLSHWHEFRLPDDRGIVMQNADEIEEADAGRHLSQRPHTRK
jgi:hypothetical protein